MVFYFAVELLGLLVVVIVVVVKLYYQQLLQALLLHLKMNNEFSERTREGEKRC